MYVQKKNQTKNQSTNKKKKIKKKPQRKPKPKLPQMVHVVRVYFIQFTTIYKNLNTFIFCNMRSIWSYFKLLNSKKKKLTVLSTVTLVITLPYYYFFFSIPLPKNGKWM